MAGVDRRSYLKLTGVAATSLATGQAVTGGALACPAGDDGGDGDDDSSHGDAGPAYGVDSYGAAGYGGLT